MLRHICVYLCISELICAFVYVCVCVCVREREKEREIERERYRERWGGGGGGERERVCVCVNFVSFAGINTSVKNMSLKRRVLSQRNPDPPSCSHYNLCRHMEYILSLTKYTHFLRFTISYVAMVIQTETGRGVCVCVCACVCVCVCVCVCMCVCVRERERERIGGGGGEEFVCV